MSETYTLSYNRLKLPGRTFFLIKPQRICAVVPPSAMQVFHPKGAYLLGPILMKDLVVHSTAAYTRNLG